MDMLRIVDLLVLIETHFVFLCVILHFGSSSWAKILFLTSFFFFACSLFNQVFEGFGGEMVPMVSWWTATTTTHSTSLPLPGCFTSWHSSHSLSFSDTYIAFLFSSYRFFLCFRLSCVICGFLTITFFDFFLLLFLFLFFLFVLIILFVLLFFLWFWHRCGLFGICTLPQVLLSICLCVSLRARRQGDRRADNMMMMRMVPPLSYHHSSLFCLFLFLFLGLFSRMLILLSRWNVTPWRATPSDRSVRDKQPILVPKGW